MIVRNDQIPQTLMQAARHFVDPDVAEAYIASKKWPDGPCCPECGSINVGHIKSSNRHQCRVKGCRTQFSLTTGSIRASVIPRATTPHIRQILLASVETGSGLYTDESSIYHWARSVYRHRSVNHQTEYVDGDVHVNGCENFFACLRRAVKGTYIRPTRDHLGAYVDEAVYRFNVRRETEWDRFNAAMGKIAGKRMTYSELTGGKAR